MDYSLIIAVFATLVVAVIIHFIVVNKKVKPKIDEYDSLNDAISEKKQDISLLEQDLKAIEEKVKVAKVKYRTLDNETKSLQSLKANADKLNAQVKDNLEKLKQFKDDIVQKSAQIGKLDKELGELKGTLDLYSRIDDFVGYGHFEMPDYLYETSARFAEEIKRIREKQKTLIKNKNAVTYPDNLIISKDKSLNNKLFTGQVKLMLSSFNFDCDKLIDNVNPGNFPRTLERIEKLANTLEKSAAAMQCAFNLKYIELKYDECRIQYQFTLKKQEEREEQRWIKEQMREEERARKEYEKAVAIAEKEEQMYRDMLEKARAELEQATEEERKLAQLRIEELEKQLAEAEAKEERAKSMAEQTRKGHVYVISNIGSFGEEVYKIGLTRRLEPMDRVKELGDASVPFAFDVHALIYVDDAPALETALHREFTNCRVNAVNLRKEFFRIDLESIRTAVDRITGIEADFKMTIAAEEYYETQRLQGTYISVA